MADTIPHCVSVALAIPGKQTELLASGAGGMGKVALAMLLTLLCPWVLSGRVLQSLSNVCGHRRGRSM